MKVPYYLFIVRFLGFWSVLWKSRLWVAKFTLITIVPQTPPKYDHIETFKPKNLLNPKENCNSLKKKKKKKKLYRYILEAYFF